MVAGPVCTVCTWEMAGQGASGLGSFSNRSIIVGSAVVHSRTNPHRHPTCRKEHRMQEFLTRLFSSDFMPHGYCYLWNPGILWLHAVSDSIITLAYYLIPLSLLYFVRKRPGLPF